MQLLPDDDEREFTSMLRRLLSVGPESPALWKSLAAAGILGLTLPERHGGSGGTLMDLGAFCVEAGRALCPTIVHSTIHAGLVVDALGTAEQHAALLPGLASGTSSAATALWSPVGRECRHTHVRTRAANGDTWVLDGCVDFVLDAQTCRLRRRFREGHCHGPNPGVRRVPELRRVARRPADDDGRAGRHACTSTTSPSRTA